ncbi:MAG: dihydrolipoyl dehydrogenase [Elusimicrobia bacterium]|nr:dihydrolipoyl dehydrogenase [Elusimicrobiota bacterium]MBD3411916.1 dihydrolipoyl dehydrogenase [Elusimicrobiota bacterium]
MKSRDSYDVIVIGAGPGGLAAAIRLTQRKKKVLLVEQDSLGGTCLNRGCIPTKSLLASALMYKQMQHTSRLGISVSDIKPSIEQIFKRKTTIVNQLRSALEKKLKTYGIDSITGTASFSSDHAVTIKIKGEGIASYSADHFVIATGSAPRDPLKLAGISSCISTDAALDLGRIPDSILIIGAGNVGIELATFFCLLGSRVSIIEMLPSMLAHADEEVVGVVYKELERMGISMHFSSTVIGCGEAGAIVKGDDGKKFELGADSIIWAGGRKPNIDTLDLHAAGIDHDAKGIKINEHMRTSNKSVFAIGDCTGGEYQFAYTAEAEGLAVAETIAGTAQKISYKGVPWVVYTDPEVAWVGLTEKKARETFGEDSIRVGKFPFTASGRALIEGKRKGFVKVITNLDGIVLGVHMVGAHAGELIAAAVPAVKNSLYVSDWKREDFAHPVFHEAVFMAGEDCFNMSTDLPRKQD